MNTTDTLGWTIPITPEMQEKMNNMITWGYFEWYTDHPASPLHHIPLWESADVSILRQLPVICDYAYRPTPENPQVGGGMYEGLIAGKKYKKKPGGGEFWMEKLPSIPAYYERVKQLQNERDKP